MSNSPAPSAALKDSADRLITRVDEAARLSIRASRVGTIFAIAAIFIPLAAALFSNFIVEREHVLTILSVIAAFAGGAVSWYSLFRKRAEDRRLLSLYRAALEAEQKSRQPEHLSIYIGKKLQDANIAPPALVSSGQREDRL